MTLRLGPNHRMHLPARYQDDWTLPFQQAVGSKLRPRLAILDVGSGRNPAIPCDRRPSDCEYIGLDISERELEAAGLGAYDSTVVADVVTHIQDLTERFDLAISWQVLEHVKSLPDALDNIRTYLKPGGHFVAQLSGRYSVFGLLNQVVPHRVAKIALQRLLHHNPERVFPAHYHDCFHSAIERHTRAWSSFEVIPLHQGAYYFTFSRILQRLYASYENHIIERHWNDLATHFLLIGTR